MDGLRNSKNLGTLLVDIDGTLITQTDGNYSNALPIKEAIDTINKLYDEGFKIILFTSRYMERCNNNIGDVYTQGYFFTINQMNKMGVKFDELKMGKPRADFIIDDRCPLFNGDWKLIYELISRK